MNLAIVGNHNIDLTRSIATKILAMLVVLSEEPSVDQWGETSMVRIRAPRSLPNPASPVESLTLKLATELSLTVGWHRPRDGGRAAVYDRDYELIEGADRVMAFFREDRLMEGGTGHVVHAALVKGVPVEAWALSPDGNLYIVGSDEGFEVGEEGSRWMQWRYQEWAAKHVEDQLRFDPVDYSGLLTSNKPVETYVGTVTGVSISGNGGSIVIPGGRAWIRSDIPASGGIANGTIVSNRSTLKF